MRRRGVHRLGGLLGLLVSLAGPQPLYAACLPTNPDIAVYGIELGDPLSTALQLGVDYTVTVDESGQIYAAFTNRAETEVLLLYRLFGDKTDVFEQVEVVATGDLETDLEVTLLDTPRFRTGRGVGLGMAQREILELFGACPAVAEAADTDVVVVRYEIGDVATSEFLKTHNMPMYYAEYAFRRGRLVRFAFGFSFL